MELPYYMTPLIGALAWDVLLGPQTGLLNQAWQHFGASGDFFNIYSPWGIAWVMGLFESTVAFVIISAAMKSMDPSLEEGSRVLGGSKLRTVLRITLPLVLPGVLSATIMVFAEMLGSFAAAFVLGIPGPSFVITTAIWEATLSYPPEYGRAAAMGLSLFGVMLVTIGIARFVIRRGSYVTITGKAFRPRPMDVGLLRWPLMAHRLGLHLCRGGSSARRVGTDVLPALRHRHLAAGVVHAGELQDRHRHGLAGARLRELPDWPAGQLLVRRPPTELFAEGSQVTISFAPEHCVLL